MPLERLKQLFRSTACREKSKDSVEVAGAVMFIDTKSGIPGPKLRHFSCRSAPAALAKSSRVRP